ncbi:MAG: hypothetical protein ACLFS4_06270 [Opitutales bacterium]
MKPLGFRCLLLLGCLASTVCIQAASFDDGLDAYKSGDYEEAREHFRAALKNKETAALRHNLGLTELRLDNPGAAIRHIERAIFLKPFDTKSVRTLEKLREEHGLPESPLRMHQRLARALSFNTWAALLNIAVLTALAAWALPAAAGYRTGGILKTARALSLLVLLIAIAGLRLNQRLQQSGTITANESVTLHVAPAQGAPEAGTARPGERARQTDQHGTFRRIKTETGATGWILKKRFQRITE